MPKKRAIMLISWFGRNANVIMTVLAFAVLALGVFNLVLYLDLRDQQSRLSGIEIGRIVEQRASNKSAVQNCRSGIPLVRTANVLIENSKSDLLQRAASSRQIARITDDKALRENRLKAAVDAERKAAALTLFPKRTMKDCNELRDTLRAELELKFGTKLRLLEEEERRSQKSDA